MVKQAQVEGYTEPDPKIDLSGIDVMRKILILARESGYPLELDDIQNESFLPEECLKTENVEEFFNSLESHKDHFNQLFKSAQQNNSRLKYVAQFDNGKASVGLEEIPQHHPFYNLEGKDNIVLFYTERYVEQPLIIKGAGAGADQRGAQRRAGEKPGALRRLGTRRYLLGFLTRPRPGGADLPLSPRPPYPQRSSRPENRSARVRAASDIWSCAAAPVSRAIPPARP